MFGLASIHMFGDVYAPIYFANKSQPAGKREPLQLIRRMPVKYLTVRFDALNQVHWESASDVPEK